MPAAATTPAPAHTQASRRRPWRRATSIRRSRIRGSMGVIGPLLPGAGPGCPGPSAPNPTICTSGTRSTPVASRTLARTWPMRPAHVVGRAAVVGLDEVGVLGRNLGRAQPQPLEPAGVDQPAGRVAGRVREHRAGVAPARLVLPPPADDLGDDAAPPPRRRRESSAMAAASHHLVGGRGRVPVAEDRRAGRRPPRPWPDGRSTHPAGRRGGRRVRRRAPRRSCAPLLRPSRARRPPTRDRGGPAAAVRPGEHGQAHGALRPTTVGPHRR